MYSKEVLLAGFSRWLEVMNYDPSSLRYAPVRLQEFLDWMISAGVTGIEDITAQRVEGFFDYLAGRKSKTTGQPLSLATQRNYLCTVNRFARYLRHSDQGNIPVPVRFHNEPQKPKVILTRAEIERLYQVIDDSLIGMRDRAMLAIFYGCGLRRNEAFHLEVKDILPGRNLVHVRRGKGHKSRYVPMVGRVKADLLNYLLYARPMLMVKQGHPMFFTGINGQPLGKTALYERLIELYEQYPTLDDRGKRNKVILGLLIFQGITTAGLHQLEPGHIKLKESKVYIPATGKTNSRVLDLEAAQLLDLQEYLLVIRERMLADTGADRPGRKPDQVDPRIKDQLFFSQNGSSNIKNSLHNLFRMIKRTNPKVTSGAVIRSSLITHWLKTKDIRMVQYMAGHRYVSSTERYDSQNLEELKEALKKHHPLK